MPGKETASQTPLRKLTVGEDKKFLSTRGTDTDLPGGSEPRPFGFDSEHCQGVLHALNELRTALPSGQLIDVTIVDAKGGRARAHRIVVAGVMMFLFFRLSTKGSTDHECVLHTASCTLFEALVAKSSYAGAAQKLAPLEITLKALHPALESVTAAEMGTFYVVVYHRFDMYIYIYLCIHAHTHTTHTQTHTNTHAHAHTRTRTCTLTFLRMHTHSERRRERAGEREKKRERERGRERREGHR